MTIRPWRCRPRARRGDRGAAGLEQVGAVSIGAVLVTALVTVFVPAAEPIRTFLGCTIGEYVGVATSCPAPVLAAGTDNGDRRDAERDARGDRRDDATGRRGGGGSTDGPGTAGTPGDAPIGVGAPVPGTSVPTPSAPAWTAPDKGSGAHDTANAGLKDRAIEAAAEAFANAVAGALPHASRNLLHYLGNSGTTFAQDVDAMLADVPEFKDAVGSFQDSIALTAVEQAQAAGATGPVTMPVSMPWQGFYIEPGMSKDWYLAVGGIAYTVVGQVTVYPPTTPGGPWNYEMTTHVEIRDQYNWDKGKATDIGPIHVTDQQMGHLNTVGLAQEYTVVGSSSTTTTKGTAP